MGTCTRRAQAIISVYVWAYKALIMTSATRAPSERSTNPSAPEARALQDRTFCCVFAPSVPPRRGCCGLGQRPRPCSRPLWSWPFARTSWSKYSAKLQADVTLSQRTFYFSRFRGKRARGGHATGPLHPGRLYRCYRCDNATLIGRPAPLAQGACEKAQGLAQASVTPFCPFGGARSMATPPPPRQWLPQSSMQRPAMPPVLLLQA